MKNTIFTLMLLATITISAQNREPKMNRMDRFADFSPTQIAQIKTKQLTLALNLTVSQQQKIEAIEIKKAESRKAKIESRKEKQENNSLRKPSANKKFALINEHLNRKIAFKLEMKQLLNHEQFKKWEKLQANKKLQKNNI